MGPTTDLHSLLAIRYSHLLSSTTQPWNPRVSAKPAAMDRPMKYRCAVLDDYQKVALTCADWSTVTNDVEVKVFDQPFKNSAEVCRALQGFQIIAIMRERTPFLRDTIAALPDLKLLITTGG